MLDLVDPLISFIAIAETLSHVLTHGGGYVAARLEIEERLTLVRKELKQEVPLFLVVLVAVGAMVFNARTVHEWSRADLMAVLCRRLDGSQLQAVIEKLIEPG